jgi:hypothetical protein
MKLRIIASAIGMSFLLTLAAVIPASATELRIINGQEWFHDGSSWSLVQPGRFLHVRGRGLYDDKRGLVSPSGSYNGPWIDAVEYNERKDAKEKFDRDQRHREDDKAKRQQEQIDKERERQRQDDHRREQRWLYEPRR